MWRSCKISGMLHAAEWRSSHRCYSLKTNPENGSSKSLKNVRNYSPIEKSSHPRRHESLKSHVRSTGSDTLHSSINKYPTEQGKRHVWTQIHVVKFSYAIISVQLFICICHCLMHRNLWKQNSPQGTKEATNTAFCIEGDNVSQMQETCRSNYFPHLWILK